MKVRSGSRLVSRLAHADRFLDRALGRRLRTGTRGDDDGFVLLESVVAISLISVIMAAFTTFFVNAVASTSQQRATQTATQIADASVETIRGLPPSDLVTGRDAQSVATQFSAPTATSDAVAPWLASMTPVSDPLAADGSGPTATIPTVPPSPAPKFNSTSYSVNYYLGRCWVPTADTYSTAVTCGTTPATGMKYLRAVVAVTWIGAHCPTVEKVCTYVTATLINADADPVFNINAIPPAALAIVDPGAQTSAVNDVVSLQLSTGTTGVPVLQWTEVSGLPAGLTLGPSGLISGTPTTPRASAPVTVTVTDGFGRTDVETFNWTILPPLLIAAPGDQAGMTFVPITTLTLSATGGVAPYTWSDPAATLPPGLTITTVSGQGRVTGTPQTVGTYPVTVTVTDSTTTRKSTVSFTWTITAESTPPVNQLSLSNVVGGAYQNANTVYYLGSTAGSFKVTNALTDVGSGVASSATVALGGTTAGWTHTPSTVSTPAGGPYVSNTFTWAAGSTSSPTEVVTGRDRAGNATPTTLTFTNDSTAPAATVSYPDGYRAAGSVPVTFTSSDSGSGVATAQLQRQSATLTGSTCGSYGAWGNLGPVNPTSVYSDSTATTGSCYQYRYVVTDFIGNQSIATSANVAKLDTTGPIGGSVDASGLVGTGSRYSTSTTLSLTLAKGADPAGVAATGAQLLRATAPLANGACGTYGSYVQVGANDPPSPKSDTVADAACYRYQYVVSDTVGNSTTYTSPDIKVDTSAPAAPTFALSAFSNTFASGNTVYYRSAAGSGTFTVTANSTDASAGIASYAFPGFGAGWTSSAGALGVNTYSWSAPNPAAPGSPTVTATNNASLTSAGSAITMTADNTAPAAGSITYANGTQTGTTVSVAFTTGSDSQSGVGTRLLQRSDATLTGSTCGAYSAYATVSSGSNPTSPVVDAVTAGRCYMYQYVVADNVGNATTAGSANTVKVSPRYYGVVSTTTGLLGYYRLGEDTTTLDTFAGTAGATLDSRTGEIGASWTASATNTGTTVITNSGRIRKGGTNTSRSAYYSSGIPPTPDYTVEANVYVASNLTNDAVGVLGRLDTSVANGTYYLARYEQPTRKWTLYRVVNGTSTQLAASAAQTLTAGASYRLMLDMNGSTLRVLVDGAPLVSVTDATITAAGRGGVAMGLNLGTNTTDTDTTGLHLDSFRVVPRMLDSNGSADGTYNAGVTLSSGGALTGDSDTAAVFNGTDGYSSIPRTIRDDFSIEFWFNSTQGIGTAGSGTQWWNGAALVDADSIANTNDFGVSLLADGHVVAGVGSGGSGPDTSIVSTNANYDDGTWHHVVFTRSKSSGALKLFVDGASAGSATGTTVSLTGSSTIGFGQEASGGKFYAGALDEVALYNTVLSSATVAAHYNAR